MEKDRVKMNRRIVFVIGSMGRGGAERVISILANTYAREGLYTNEGGSPSLEDEKK